MCSIDKRRRYVSLSRTDPHGLRMVIARVEGIGPALLTQLIDLIGHALGASAPDRYRGPHGDRRGPG